eukprot:scaffold869_cov75-Skeletonema_dohrnii-CCMP3373.AAC.2
MIIKHNAILILSTSFLGGCIAAAADDSTTTAQRRLQLPPLQQTFSARGAPPNPLPNCHGDYSATKKSQVAQAVDSER